MKRMLSLFLVMIMILLIIMPSYVLAENPIVPIFRYGNIKILVPPKGYNIEDDFREFVKQVSRMYYSGRLDGVNGVYDLNKYYYQAAEVKHEWDDGGFFWSRRDNPYSTYYDYEDYEKYNASAVQSMLINGIQEKANELKGLDTNKSKFRISANPTNGKWEINGEALIAQSIYDKNLEGTLAKAEQNIVAGDLIGSLIDTGIAVFSGGAAPSAVYELIDSISAVVTNSIVAYTDRRGTKECGAEGLGDRAVLAAGAERIFF